MNLDALNGLDLNGAFKIANLVVAGLSVRKPRLYCNWGTNVLTNTGFIWSFSIIQWNVSNISETEFYGIHTFYI